MRLADLWRTSRFRLTLLYGALFAAGVLALLALIYWQTAGFMVGQADTVVRADAETSLRTPPEALVSWIEADLARDVRRIKYYGLFAPDGRRVVGNLTALPRGLKIGAPPRAVDVMDGPAPDVRAMAVKLQDGSVLVIGRDDTQLRYFRTVILDALIWCGALIVLLGLSLGAALSVRPLRHVQAIRDSAGRIREGDFNARLPTAGGRDELDLLAGIVNAMLEEVQRLVSEVKSASDGLAHDLRTPLTRLRALLHRVDLETELPDEQRALLEQAIGETDTLLTRFRALLRISEIESRERRVGFGLVDLRQLARQIAELYGPVAAARDIELEVRLTSGLFVEGDKELLFEALSNLVDNAIKFSPDGGTVRLIGLATPHGPRLEVVDCGRGVAPAERNAVLQRFYRSPHAAGRPGSGLGLSIVAAIVRLHGFTLELQDAGPGLRISLDCWPDWAAP